MSGCDDAGAMKAAGMNERAATIVIEWIEMEAGGFILFDGSVFENRLAEIPPVMRRASFFEPEHNPGHKRLFVSTRVGFKGNSAGQKI